MPHIEVVDPTRLRDALQCLRLYYWRHERGLVTVKPRLPLIYGSGVHATLAAYYEGKSIGLALKEFDKIWMEKVISYQESLDDMMDDDPKRNPRRWAETFVLYRQHYKTETFKVRNVETPFFLPLTDRVAIAGIIDLLVEYLGQLMVIDHKTTSVTYPSYYASFNPNHQFSTYLLGATEILGQPITTCLVNCLVTHQSEMRPEKLFNRVPTTRSPAQHEFLKQEIVEWWTIVQECRRRNSWPRNDDRCQRWAGGCDYHPLCTDIMTDYRKIIPPKSMFREEVWDPIAQLREHGYKETI